MRRSRAIAVIAFACGLAAAPLVGCGGSSPSPGFLTTGADSGVDATTGQPGVDASPLPNGGDASPLTPTGNDATPPTMTTTDGGIACPTGLTCNVACTGGKTTTISGKVYDPAAKNPLYNVAVYVPATPLTPLPKGVTTGSDACSCGALFKSGALTNTTTTVDGSFTLANVPVGSDVPLVIQIGKWRRQFKLNVTGCQDNPQADKSLAFLGTIPAGDTDDSMPDIAVSTGGADTLECLMIRVGVPASEYVAGASTAGHIHVFAGGNDGTSSTGTGGGGAQSPGMPGAPKSWVSLWDKQADMMPYDVVLLSCEGDETYNSNAPVLESYLNAGGRAFGSHYHYAWFAGSLQGENVPAPPADWGANLASWGPMLTTTTSGAAQVVQTLTGTNNAFPKGVALKQWLGNVNALGVESAPAGEIPIVYENQDVGATNKAQAWLTDNGYTDYLSFDTPVSATATADGGAPQYCGRAVFSDIHVASDTTFTTDMPPPPAGCGVGELSPQEKALEFMLFDLSSCVVPDTVAVPLDAGLPPPPAK